jgi:hypothetical protein
MTDHEDAQAIAEARTFCNVLAMEKGLDPAGYAGDFEDAVIFEMPLPWKKNLYEPEGGLPAQALMLLALWLQRYHETGEYPHRPLLIAPDAAYSRAGMRRVMFYTRPTALFSQYDKTEYVVPEGDLGGLLWAWYENRAALPEYERYRAPESDGVRDIMVCTHGTVDAACAKFGYPLYHLMRQTHAHERLRVWRVSHFGGHVFAPTLIDLPTGHYWAYVEAPQARQIVAWDGEASDLRGHYRGWAGVHDGFLQAFERECWLRHGWAWFAYDKAGEVLERDTTDPENPLWADVRVSYRDPYDGQTRAYHGRVEVQRHLETNPSSADSRVHAYPQYRVVALEPATLPDPQ